MYNKEIHLQRLRLAENDEFKEKGREEGFKEGHTAGVCETAKNLLKEKVELDIISRSTGLSVEELEKLKKEVE